MRRKTAVTVGIEPSPEFVPPVMRLDRYDPDRPQVTTGRVPAPGANPAVDHPAHYNQHPSGVECIEVIRHMPHNLGAAVKYLWRAGLKDQQPSVQDLRKAVWYIEDHIRMLEEEEARGDDYA